MVQGLGRELRFWAIALLVFFAAVFILRDILLPFVAGMAIAYLLDPACDWLEKKGLSRTLATTVLTGGFLLLSVGAVLLLVPLVAGQVAGLVGQVSSWITNLQDRLPDILATIQDHVDDELMSEIKKILAGSAKELVQWVGRALSGLITGVDALINLTSLLVITPVVTFYLLRDWDRLVTLIDSWLPKHYAETIREQVGEVDRTLSGFVRGQSSVCAVLGIFYAVALTLSGLKFGLVIGLAAGLLSFIPFVGSGVGFVASVGMAFLQFDGWVNIAIVAAIFVVGQAVEGNFLTPKLVGDRVGLHALWVIFALLAGGLLFGFVGILLAVPVTAVIGVVTRFLMGRYLDSVFYWGDSERPTPAADEQAES